jgi:hypothetical protein
MMYENQLPSSDGNSSIASGFCIMARSPNTVSH